MHMIHRLVDRCNVNESTGCLEWSGNKVQGGYGRVRVNGRMLLAHRLMWELTRGSIGPGLCVCHSCDNPSCILPSHLFIGTHQDNVNDREAKHRNVVKSGDEHYARRFPEKVPRGERSGQAKLKSEDVLQIRIMYNKGRSRKEIAGNFGITQGNVDFIVKRKTWKHVA